VATTPQIQANGLYKSVVSTGDTMMYIESVGGVTEWAIALNSPVLTSFATSLTQNKDNTSGTPGNASTSRPRGRSAIAAGATACVITSGNIDGSEAVFVQLSTVDTTLTRVTVVVAPGQFTVTGNAAATAAVSFEWIIIN